MAEQGALPGLPPAPDTRIVKRSLSREVAATHDGVTAQVIVGAWCDWTVEKFTALPPSDVIKRVARQVKQAIVDGRSQDSIKIGLALWTAEWVASNRTTPERLGSIIWNVETSRTEKGRRAHEETIVAAAPTSKSVARQTKTDAEVQAWLDSMDPVRTIETSNPHIPQLSTTPSAAQVRQARTDSEVDKWLNERRGH